MRVEIHQTPEAAEAYAVIYTAQLTPEIRRAATLLEEEASQRVVTASDNGRIVVLQPDEIFLIRVEREKTMVYTEKNAYISKKRLYELETVLGNGFLHISKSAAVNLRQLRCVEPSLGGLMLLVLKNGCKEYISRSYLPAFKQYLGL